MKEERWLPVVGYEGFYEVSSLGRVKSLNYNKTGKEKIMKQVKNRNGYLQVGLCKNGKMILKSVHRLVAVAFIPNPNNYPQVNHINENKEDNRVDNLEWCTRKYNTNYGTRNERISSKLTNHEKKSKPVLCVETGVVYISAHEAERQTGVYHPNIIACCKGKYKTTGGYHWQYEDLLPQDSDGDTIG